MRITVLGFQSPYPGPGGATPGYLIQTENTNILLDCGSGVLAQLGKYLPIHQLDAVFLSHYHQDHIADVGVLQFGINVHQRVEKLRVDHPLPIYGPPHPTKHAEEMTYKEATTFHPISSEEDVVIGDVTISVLKTDHPILCYAMKIVHNQTTLLYSADTGQLTNWSGFCEAPDLFICEGTFLDGYEPETPIGHLSVRQAANLAVELQAKSLLVTHLYHTYESEDVLLQASAFTGDCHAAKIGLQIHLSEGE
ncbi:MBL fold metallo-hydrolase [Brevibacillus daliensis]|uniref:MBL fold metallo-hydrolase n=1 Tax=Brevibacillus daliensis TaxID=2892995 RepID=UPI001E3303BF|nr:MBL fold metallo-hydrolase [Brevibacillus daliensis]